MGLYDRDYVRQDGPSFLGSLSDRGKVCKWLIGINVILFLGQLITADTDAITNALILNVQLVMQGQVWRLLTHGFLHSTETPLHILFNMLFLWWFGKDMEDIYGPREFLTFYLTAIVLGGAVFILTHLGGGLALGASGGVTAVLVLAACHYPNRTLLLFFVLPIPLWLFVVIFVGLDAFVFFRGLNTNVGVSVHLAGALFGYLYYRSKWRLSGWLSGWSPQKMFKPRPRLRIYEEAPPPRATADMAEEELLEARMDAVLEKMASQGPESLTESEREILVRASELYKRRRH